MGLQGQKIIIIGGASGIGQAIARQAVAQGAAVTVSAADEQQLEGAQLGEGVDVCAFEACDARAMDYCFEQLGLIHHLIATPADPERRPFPDTEIEDAREAFEGKFWSQYLAVQQALPFLDPEGSVLLCSGPAAPGGALGGAIDRAVEGLAAALAAELAPLRVNVIAPSYPSGEAAAPEPAAPSAVGSDRHAALAAAALRLLSDPEATGRVLRSAG